MDHITLVTAVVTSEYVSKIKRVTLSPARGRRAHQRGRGICILGTRGHTSYLRRPWRSQEADLQALGKPYTHSSLSSCRRIEHGGTHLLEQSFCGHPASRIVDRCAVMIHRSCVCPPNLRPEGLGEIGFGGVVFLLRDYGVSR